MFGLWRENNLFGLSSIFTRIFLSVCRRLLPTCLPHLKNWQQAQLVPQKVLQILLIECRICRCNCIFLHENVYIYTLLQQTLLLIFIIIYCCSMGFSSHRNLLLRVCIALLTEVRGEKLLSAKESPTDLHATKDHMLVDLKPFKTFQNYH